MGLLEKESPGGVRAPRSTDQEEVLLIETSVARPARIDTREHRALVLAGECFEEIAGSYRDGSYTVPSLHGEHSYYVRYTDTDESCECPDWTYRGATCYHVLAAAVVRAKTYRRADTQEHPHACRNGYVYLGYTSEDGEEVVEALPCRRCSETEAS